MTEQYYIYILYSTAHDKYYVGYSNDPHRRLLEHNTKPFNTFTSKYRPWELVAVFSVGSIEGDAIKLEQFIKRQKSRRLLEQLADPAFRPTRALGSLVRVTDPI